MKSVRIEPLYRLDEDVFGVAVDVVCDCGLNGLKNEDTGETSFKHIVKVSSFEPPIVLVCECGAKYQVLPQRTHVHVNQIEAGTAS